MNCIKCNSARIASVCAKCSDCCGVNLGSDSHDGYVPDDMGIGGGDYVEFSWCLDCGQLQGKFPKPVTEMEKDCTDEELKEFFDENFTVGEMFCNIHSNRQVRINNSAEEISYKLRTFIGKVLQEYRDIYSKVKVPTTETFIKKYRANDWELE